jgi:hypothetical protein
MLGLIVVMNGLSFFVDSRDLSGRLGIVVTLFLSAVAFNFAVASSLPKVGYLTQFDVYVLVCYWFILAVMIQNIISFMSNKFMPAAEDVYFNAIDYLSLFVFPVLFLLFHIFYIIQIRISREARLRLRRFKEKYVSV